MLKKAEEPLRQFSGSIDAIISYWDFPGDTMVPILCEKFGLPSPSLEDILKCGHKYWARLEQQKIIPEHIPRFCASTRLPMIRLRRSTCRFLLDQADQVLRLLPWLLYRQRTLLLSAPADHSQQYSAHRQRLQPGPQARRVAVGGGRRWWQPLHRRGDYPRQPAKRPGGFHLQRQGPCQRHHRYAEGCGRQELHALRIPLHLAAIHAGQEYRGHRAATLTHRTGQYRV